MKNLIIVLSLCFLASTIQAFSSDHLSPGQKLLLKAQMKHRLLNPKRSEPRERTNCLELFNEQRDVYDSKVAAGHSRNLKVAIGPNFSRDEIENSPEGWPHLKVDLRGIKADPIPRLAVISGQPRFPHTNQDCENFFEESVEVIEVDSKLCRRVTFEAPELGDQSYSQTYCEDDYDVTLYFN